MYVAVNPQEGFPISWDPGVQSDAYKDTFPLLLRAESLKQVGRCLSDTTSNLLDIPQLIYHVRKEDGLSVLLKCLGVSRLKHVTIGKFQQMAFVLVLIHSRLRYENKSDFILDVSFPY